MTVIKLHAQLPKAGNSGLPGALAERMWENLGASYIAIVEFRVAERTEPADAGDEDGAEPSARLRVTGIGVAPDPAVDEDLRHVMRALYDSRTADGTLPFPRDPAQVLRHGTGLMTLGEAVAGVLAEHVSADTTVSVNGGAPAKGRKRAQTGGDQ